MDTAARYAKQATDDLFDTLAIAGDQITLKRSLFQSLIALAHARGNLEALVDFATSLASNRNLNSEVTNA